MKKFKPVNELFLLLFFMFFAASAVPAQTPDSIFGTPEFMGYESLSILCVETPYFGTTTWSSPSSQPAGFCESIENDEFICFQTANSTEVVFEFSLLSCSGSGSGIEVGVVDQSGISVGTCIIVDDPSGQELLELTGLDPLTQYCLRIDGIQGANCDYAFEALSGVTGSVPRQPEIYGPATSMACYGDQVELSVGRIPNATGYFWQTRNANGFENAVYLDGNYSQINGLIPVPDSTVTLVLPSFDITRAPGICDTIYSAVTAVNACGVSIQSLEWSISLCTTIIDSVTISTCNSDSVGIEYPAGSGNLFFSNGGTYQSAPIPNGNCGEVTAVLVEEGTGSAPDLVVDTTICSFPVILEGDTIVSEGLYEFYFPVANSECDSIVSYTVRSPSAQGAALDNPYCTGEFVRVGNSPWDNNFTYTWTDAQGNLAGSTPNDYLNQFENQGVYTLTVSHLGCEYLIDVIVELAPELEMLVDNDFLTVNAGGGSDSVALFLNGDFIMSSTTSSLVYQGISNITDSVSFVACAYSDCGRICETVVIEGVLSSREVSSIADLLVWPNPSSGVFNIQLEGATQQRLEVYSVVGKLVFSDLVNSDAQIDLVELPAGMYMLVLKDAETHLPIAREQLIIR